MLKHSLQFKLSQKLSPQQIQLMKLIQLPTQAFEQRIEEELVENPALESGKEEIEDYEDAFAENSNEYDDDFDNEKIMFEYIKTIVEFEKLRRNKFAQVVLVEKEEYKEQKEQNKKFKIRKNQDRIYDDNVIQTELKEEEEYIDFDTEIEFNKNLTNRL